VGDVRSEGEGEESICVFVGRGNVHVDTDVGVV
jgi:hypothetical protein